MSQFPFLSLCIHLLLCLLCTLIMHATSGSLGHLKPDFCLQQYRCMLGDPRGAPKTTEWDELLSSSDPQIGLLRILWPSNGVKDLASGLVNEVDLGTTPFLTISSNIAFMILHLERRMDEHTERYTILQFQQRMARHERVYYMLDHTILVKRLGVKEVVK